MKRNDVHSKKTFLQLVADSLIQKFGTNLSRLTVVFPGKRAGLFLNQALADASPTPVWTPRYQTISELFEQASSYALCDTIEAVCRLYRVYARYVVDATPLDQFYAWGEVMLADFDDIDKHLADAHRLFANVHDLKQLDDNSYITPEQEKALRTFFSNFSIEGNTELKQRFLDVWSKMGAIYDDFNQTLRTRGLLCEGALQRDVVERMRKGENLFNEGTTYVFVGFNILNSVEEALFDQLQARRQALFYWDYDIAYTGGPGVPKTSEAAGEAGLFLRRNLLRYPCELMPESFDNLRADKRVTLVATTSDYAQASFIPQWLNDHLGSQENRTAIVLCDEQLLRPVLHCLPSAPTPHSVNVTMGYPLTDTPVYSFVCALLSLQTDGYDPVRRRFRTSLLKAAASSAFARLVGEDVWKRVAGSGTDLLDYLLEVCERLATHFVPSGEGELQDEPFFYQSSAEALFQIFTALSRLRNLMTGEHPLLNVSDQTFRRLLRTILQAQTIPFHGEPATGLQVMGVLETRALDFDHLLMLGAGEGFMPKASSETSFIPYYLREAFGLTTNRHQTAVYAYYFYRLLQRTYTATFVYNESNVGTRQREMSRLLRQLLAETQIPIRLLRLSAGSTLLASSSLSRTKTTENLDLLRHIYDLHTPSDSKKSALSPSALNTYTSCPLRFYYRYVCGMRIDPDPQDGLDAILFGQVFHRAAELLYRHLTAKGSLVRAEDIRTLTGQGDNRLQTFVRQAFRDEFFHEQPEDYSGILIIAERVIHTYLRQLLNHDLRLTPFRILGLEERRTTIFDVGDIRVETGGIIDRLDEVADPAVEGGRALRVVDYKTGGMPGGVKTLPQLFAEAGQKEEYYLQTLLYASIVAQDEGRPVTPCLFFVHKAGGLDYTPKLKIGGKLINDVRDVVPEYTDHLIHLIGEIFDPNVSFAPTTKTETCRFCPYRKLCGKADQ